MLNLRFQKVATIPCIILGFGSGAAYFGSLETDATKPIMVRHPDTLTFAFNLTRPS